MESRATLTPLNNDLNYYIYQVFPKPISKKIPIVWRNGFWAIPCNTLSIRRNTLPIRSLNNWLKKYASFNLYKRIFRNVEILIQIMNTLSRNVLSLSTENFKARFVLNVVETLEKCDCAVMTLIQMKKKNFEKDYGKKNSS